jgi:adenine-specific DNA-methyltransferase
LIWAESVTSDGRFEFRAARRNHAPWLVVGPGDKWLTVRRACILLQRTTAKEQARRLIAAELPEAFLRQYGAVSVENHLNMVVPVVARPAVDVPTLAAFLNSTAADQAFRCISGSVAPSAYELEALPLPAPERLSALTHAVQEGRERAALDEICGDLFSP